MAKASLILDRYRVIGEAGAGACGTVQHAYDTRLKRDVAVKRIELSPADVARARLLAMDERLREEQPADVLPWEDDPAASAAPVVPAAPAVPAAFPADPAFLDLRERATAPLAGADAAAEDLDDDELFDHIPGLEEARTAAHLNDANIVTVYDCEVHGTAAYVVMEYVEGKTLAHVLREMGDDISLDVAAAVLGSVAHALEVAHARDVLHLDIKPENVIVNRDGVVKVTDFGLATLMDAGGRATAGGGTIGYMPLEQMRQQPLDVRTDEWALASLAYEMLSGANPFVTDDLRKAEELVEEAELVLPSLCWEGLGGEVDDVIFKALDPDPDERYATVAAFAADLVPLLGDAEAGRAELAALARGEAARAAEEPPAPREPGIPLVDRLGARGASVAARVVAVAGAAGMAAFALANVRLHESAVLGLASSHAPVFWVGLGVCAVLAGIRPAFGSLLAFALVAVMLLFNGGIVPGAVLLVAAAAWWWFSGRRRDGSSAVAFLQPLFGAVGLSAAAPVAAGALLAPRDAAATAAFAAVGALAFASFGSGSILGWDALANATLPASSAVAAPQVMGAFLSAVVLPSTWCCAASWVLAALAYSLFCERGRRGFDIAGSVVALVLLVAGSCAGAGADAIAGVALQGASLSAALPAAAWLPSLPALVGSAVPGALGVLLAVMGVPDRVRLVEGEW